MKKKLPTAKRGERACPECGIVPPGHKIACKTGNELARRNQAGLPRNRRDGQKSIALIHVGKCVPKSLLKAGWQEVSAMHLGKGMWLIRCEQGKAPSVGRGSDSVTASSNP